MTVPAMPASEAERDDDVERTMFAVLTATNNEMAVLHRELGRKTHELEQAIAEKNEFLGMAAHDLRNPLHVIGGMSAVLLRSPNVTDKERRLLQSISDSSAFMRQLVEDLLHLAEFQAGAFHLQRAPFDLGALLLERVEVQRQVAADKGIPFGVRVPSGTITINGDRMRLTQLMDNLLSNAAKYSHPGAMVMVHLHASADWLRISVRDRGQGIPPGELGRLFQPFSVTSTRSTAGEKSTGLGLVIVKRIAEAHHGCVRVRSRVGVGTSFYVMLRTDQRE